MYWQLALSRCIISRYRHQAGLAMRVWAGKISAVLAIILSMYVILMVFNILPAITVSIFNESFIRFIAEVTVFLYLLAAWSFWDV